MHFLRPVLRLACTYLYHKSSGILSAYPCHPCNPWLKILVLFLLVKIVLSRIPWLNSKMKHEQLTHDIIGAAMAVLNALKPGLDEKLYENALVIELIARGHKVEQQREYPVYYRDRLIGTLRPDLIVDDKVIADPKVATDFSDSHIAQMVGYLNITGLEVALLLNFKAAKLSWKRVAGREETAELQQPQDGRQVDLRTGQANKPSL
jgi:GxxExxY protein